MNGVRVHTEGRVGYLQIDRQHRRNALDRAAKAALIDGILHFEADADIWVLVVTGAGDVAFSAGRDLKELAGEDQAGVQLRTPLREKSANLYEMLYHCEKPTVAAINGWAVGGGLELALACDLRVASERARFAMPEAHRGLGGTFGAQMLHRLIEPGRANEILYFGDEFDADQALRWGLITQVFPHEQFCQSTREYVEALAERAPLTLRRYKTAARSGADMPLSAALRLHLSPTPYESDDRREGVAAFVERRKPIWRGR